MLLFLTKFRSCGWKRVLEQSRYLVFCFTLSFFYIELLLHIYIAKSQRISRCRGTVLPISFVSLSERVPNTAPTRYDNDNISLIA